MFSRLSATAALFAVLTTATLAFAASSQQDHAAAQVAARPAPVVQLETVVVTGHRLTAVQP